MRYLTHAVAIAAVLLLGACSRDVDDNGLNGGPADAASGDSGEQSSLPQPPPPQRHATLQPTKGHEATGDVTFTMRDGVVHLSGQVRNLEPNSEHGFHIHETGDCSAPDAESAGGHFNPTNQPHGKAGSGAHHVGDLQSIRADENGVANIAAQAPSATMGDGGPNDIVGKALIVHAQPDDYQTQPSGNSGDRIACGVIQ